MQTGLVGGTSNQSITDRDSVCLLADVTQGRIGVYFRQNACARLANLTGWAIGFDLALALVISIVLVDASVIDTLSVGATFIVCTTTIGRNIISGDTSLVCTDVVHGAIEIARALGLCVVFSILCCVVSG